MTTRVVNRRLGAVYDEYVGRPSIWGNRFGLDRGRPSLAKEKVATLSEALRRYEEWLFSDENSALLAKARRELRGKTLGCWCIVDLWQREPVVCHAQILARAVDGRKRPIFKG